MLHHDGVASGMSVQNRRWSTVRGDCGVAALAMPTGSEHFDSTALAAQAMLQEFRLPTT
jgi:hypothetical protein